MIGLAANLSVEHGLDVHLTSQVKLFGRRGRTLVPLLQDLPETCRVDLDVLLKFREKPVW